MAGEQRVILRKAGPAAEGLLPDRAPELLGKGDGRGPRLGLVETRPDDDHRAFGAREQLSELCEKPRVGRTARRTRRGAARCVTGSASADQSSIGTITRAGPALWQLRGRRARSPGHTLGTDRLVDPHGVLAREPVQLSRQERLAGEVAPVLLADDDHEGDPVDARGGERADRVAEAGGRVQDRERGSRRPSAQPVAMPTTALSCSPSTKRRSPGRSVRSSISVEPGFAKRVVSPCSRRTSNAASRTVSVTRRSLREAADSSGRTRDDGGRAGHGHRLRVATAVSGTSGDSTAPRTTPRDITALAVASFGSCPTLASDSFSGA